MKIEFLCDFYKGTDVPLLKFGEEDYEALENDQLTVQGMMASRYVAQFEKEVSMWSVALLNVRSRRFEVLRRLHAIDARRLQE